MQHTRFFALGLFAAALAALAGCADMDLDRKREESMTTIDTNLYLFKAYIPYETRRYQAKDYAAEKAMRFCNEKNQGMQPIEGTANFRKAGGIDVQLVFRCVNFLPTPETPFVDENEGSS